MLDITVEHYEGSRGFVTVQVCHEDEEIGDSVLFGAEKEALALEFLKAGLDIHPIQESVKTRIREFLDYELGLDCD